MQIPIKMVIWISLLRRNISLDIAQFFGEIVLAIVLIGVLTYRHLSGSIILKSQILTGIVGLIFSSLNMDIHSTESTGEVHQATRLLNTLSYLGREVMALQ